MDIYRRSYDSMRQPATSWRFPRAGVFSGTSKATATSSNVSKEKVANIDKKTENLPSLLVDLNCNIECTCERNDLAVLCTLCGFVSKGRIMQRQCSLHPKVQYLMDYAHCPHCKCSCLVEVILKNETVEKS